MNGVTTQHLLDGVNVAADVTDGQTTSFVRGLGLIGMNANGAKSYYVTDGHGDVRALTDASGTVTKNYSYDAFGNEADESSFDVNPFRYCGEYYDAETGSIYLRARYYSPVTARMLSRDTNWNPSNMIYGDNGKPSMANIMQSGNLYVYCGSNPVNRWDVTGLEWGYIRDFANDLNILFGGSPDYSFGYGGVRVTVGGGYYKKSGMFYFDGFVELQRNGGRSFDTKKVAQNNDGRLYMHRTSFYEAMNVKYSQVEQSFTVSDLGNGLQRLVASALVTIGTIEINPWAAFAIGFVAGEAVGKYQFEPGEYSVTYTVAEVYNGASNLYESILTTEYYRIGTDPDGRVNKQVYKVVTKYNGRFAESVLK